MTIDVALPRATRFSIGRVLRDSFVIFGRNILLFGGVALVVRLLSLFSPVADAVPAPDGSTNWVAFCLAKGLDTVISGLTEAAIVFAAFQCLRGRRAGAGDIVHGLRSVGPIILAGLIYGVPLYASDVIDAMLPGEDLLVRALNLVVVVGALVLIVIWWIYVPAIAIEGKGVLASFGRSAQLTKRRRWAIVGVIVLATIAVFVPLIAIMAAADASIDSLTASPLTPIGAVGYVFYALTTAFYTVLMTVAYFHLRIEKEGDGVEDIVTVFD
jgi:hypothetical protein